MDSERPEYCIERDRLEKLVQNRLRELAALASEEADVVKSEDQQRVDAVDKRIETVVGEKERALGALKQHKSEHGC